MYRAALKLVEHDCLREPAISKPSLKTGNPQVGQGAVKLPRNGRLVHWELLESNYRASSDSRIH
jgi:hypothetical protein